MEVKFEIPDKKVEYFSGNAKNKIVDHAKEYTIDIINEAERIELSTHEGDAPSEITSSHVGHAANKFRSISRVKKKKRGMTILKIISDFLLLFAGFMFLPDKFVSGNEFNIGYFLCFLIILTVAIILTIVSQFGGED